jgi:hypothetical protein
MSARRTLFSRSHTLFSACAALLLLAFAATPNLHAQAVSGTIVGTVTDATGAVVAGAPITILRISENTTYNSVTNESGNFTVPELPSGTYNVTVEVTVTTAPPQLQTDRADISTTIEAKQIADLPLSSGNSFQSLAQHRSRHGAGGLQQLAVLQRQQRSLHERQRPVILREPLPDRRHRRRRTHRHPHHPGPARRRHPNVDITTNNFEAEFGRAVGTVVNVTLKSGTNQFHGSVFQNMENNGVNARNFFAEGPQRTPRLQLHRRLHRRPILKNKLFIFGDFLRVSDHEERTHHATIPFYNVNNGNLNLAGYKGQVYDPNTGDTADCLGTTANAACGTGRTPFANNRSRSRTPASTRPPSPCFQDLDASPATRRQPRLHRIHRRRHHQQLLAEPPLQQGLHQLRHQVRLHHLPKDHLSYRFSHQNVNTFQAPPSAPSSAVPAGGGFEATGTPPPTAPAPTTTTLLAHPLHRGPRRRSPLRNSATQTDYGANDANPRHPRQRPQRHQQHPTSSGQVAFQVQSSATSPTPLIGYSVSLPWLRAESNIDFANNWTKILGNHTIKAGADIRRVRDDLLQGNNNAAAGSFYLQRESDLRSRDRSTVRHTGQANDIASVLFDVP